jgi:DNA modification methylase
MSSAFEDVVESTDNNEYDCSHGSVIHGDSLDVLDELPENEFHAIVTDPPYAISFMDREWDQFRRQRNDSDSGRDDFGGRLSSSAPASGAEGDNYEYHRWTMMWAEKAKRVLKPGGHVIAFSGNRTHHRLMAAFEDVGYEIRDTITWHYGEGMPKGARLKTWLDGEEAEKWGEWRGALKPATEFPVLFRAPLGESSATRNQVEHGVGNLNVEACRIGEETVVSNGWRSDDSDGVWDDSEEAGGMYEDTDKELREENDGRYPANLVLDPVMAEAMDLQSGERKGCTPHVVDDSGSRDVLDDGGLGETGERVEGYEDSGGASRFFYTSKASKSERTLDGEVENDHETVKPIDLMEWLIKLVTAEGQKVLDPFVGSGTTLLAAENVSRKAVGIEQNEEYADIARERFDVHTE